MAELLGTIVTLSVLTFSVMSMLGVGLSYSLRTIAAPFRYPDRIFRALVANFVLVPLLALALSRLLGLDPSLEAGMMLVAMAGGAPFVLKLTQVATANVALSAALLVLLMPLTVIYMPLALPLVVEDASVSAIGIAVPLISTLLVPWVVGLVVHAALPRLAARLQPIAAATSTAALVTLIVSTLLLNGPRFRGLLGTGAILAAALLTAGAFAMGYLISSSGFNRRTVMGLGAGQRNIAAALVVASQDFEDPNTLVMVVLFSVVDLLVLFPIAWLIRRRSGRRPGPPTHPRYPQRPPEPPRYGDDYHIPGAPP